jgi:hypothetical protein
MLVRDEPLDRLLGVRLPGLGERVACLLSKLTTTMSFHFRAYVGQQFVLGGFEGVVPSEVFQRRSCQRPA